jgi:hypothetical protein
MNTRPSIRRSGSLHRARSTRRSSRSRLGSRTGSCAARSSPAATRSEPGGDQRSHRHKAARERRDRRIRPSPSRQSRLLDGGERRRLRVHHCDPDTGAWIPSRPELDGRLLQPSDQLASQPDLVDVFPHTNRIVGLAWVDFERVADGASPIYVEISHPWPSNNQSFSLSSAMRLTTILTTICIRLPTYAEV